MHYKIKHLHQQLKTIIIAVQGEGETAFMLVTRNILDIRGRGYSPSKTGKIQDLGGGGLLNPGFGCIIKLKVTSILSPNIYDCSIIYILVGTRYSFTQTRLGISIKWTPENYDKVLTNNITQKYKLADTKVTDEIEEEFNAIAETLDISERIDTTTNRPAFITLKDHKDNFKNNPKARLINPTKSEIGRVSKQMLDRINTEIRAKTDHNKWTSTAQVILNASKIYQIKIH